MISRFLQSFQFTSEDATIVDMEAHSKRLHEVLPGSRLVVIPGAGHMAHYVAQLQIAEAVSTQVAKLPSAPQIAMGTEPALVAG